MAAARRAVKREHARRRARVGLWLGPGSFVLVTAILAPLTALLSACGIAADPDRTTLGMLLMGGGTLTVFFCHFFSFVELVVSVRGIRTAARPTAVILLVCYWGLLVAAIATAAIFGL